VGSELSAMVAVVMAMVAAMVALVKVLVNRIRRACCASSAHEVKPPLRAARAPSLAPRRADAPTAPPVPPIASASTPATPPLWCRRRATSLSRCYSWYMSHDSRCFLSVGIWCHSHNL
jgi:hypothetical protein